MEKENSAVSEQMALISDLMKKGFFKAALAETERAKFINSEAVQLERMYILTKVFENYEEAYLVWKRLEKSTNPKIVTKGVTILRELGRLDEALELANRDNLDDPKLMVAKLKVLMRLKRYDEAKAICDDVKYASIPAIEELKKKIQGLTETIIDEVSTLFTKIYADKITLDEIKSSNISEFDKNVLLLAYYERHNTIAGIHLIKALRNTKQISKDNIKILNILEQRLKSKKANYFDASLYGKLLHRQIDFDLVKELENKEEEKVNIEKVEVKEEIPTAVMNVPVRKVKHEKKMVGSEGGKRVTRYSNVNNKPTPINVVKNEVLIKDVFGYELKEVEKYLYVRMQMPSTRVKAIKAWDNLEVLESRNVKDKESLEKIIKLLKVISDNKLLDIEYNSEKVKKYI